MPSAQHQRMEQLFNAAVRKGSSSEQAAFLDDACGDDPLLRASLDDLLEAHAGAGEFLDVPVIDPNETVASGPPGEQPGGRIGNYKILQQIGEGGFGVVYMAEQERPVRRKVALKIIKLGMDTKQVIARFEAERQALALMDHPNIARVLDAGSTDSGRPYFVMELIRGINIREYCDQSKLATPERLDLFVQVCRGVQHAHQKGVIHRDIKPSNVLVTLHDATPVPKVIDFGIAKATSQRLTERTLFTQFRQFIGTPEYMSPDQAEISGLDVDTRTDIYSLGVLLYVLLTGTTPFDKAALRSADYDEIKRIIREEEPPKPSTRVNTLIAEGSDIASRRQVEPAALSKQVRGDLDWIVMKAMEKDRTRRYQTAGELAADVERHSRNEPVLAGPPSVTYKFSKFVRRNRAGVLAGGVVAAALLTGLSMAALGYVHARQARTAMELQRDDAVQARAKAETAGNREHEQRTLADASAAKSAAVSTFLQETLASVDPSTALGREVSVRYILDEAARKIAAGQLAAQPLVEADVRVTLGKTYNALGDYTAAETHLREAVRIRAGGLGADHEDTLATRSTLVAVLSSRYRYAEAESLGRQTLEAQSRVLGDEHPDTLITASRLSVALGRLEKHTEAEEIQRRTLEIQKRVLGAEHPDTLHSLANLGAVFLGQRRYSEAETILRQARDADRRVLGESHPDTMAAMNDLALALERQDKFEDAEELYRDAWQLDRRVLGPDHPLTRIPFNNLLRVLRTQNKTADTRPLVAERLDRLKRAAQRTDADAAELSAYAWELLTCEPADLCDPAAALRAAQRAVELDGGADANILDTLALAQRMTGDLDAAIVTQRRAVARARAGGPYNRSELESRLVDLLLKKGQVIEAARVSLGGLASRVGSTLTDDSIVGGSLAARAVALIKQEKFSEAEDQLHGCLLMRQKDLPGGHWLIGETQSLLGQAVAGQKRFAEAETLLLRGFTVISSDPLAPEDSIRQAISRIVRLYEAWGKPDRAAEWRDRLQTQAASDKNNTN